MPKNYSIDLPYPKSRFLKEDYHLQVELNWMLWQGFRRYEFTDLAEKNSIRQSFSDRKLWILGIF